MTGDGSRAPRRGLRSHVATAALATALAPVLIACGGDGGEAATTDGSEVDGGAIYAERCAGCHGEDLDGTGSGPALRSIVYEPDHHPDAAFRAAIAEGARQHHWDFGAMPAVPGLDEVQVEAVIAHVREEQERLGYVE